MKHPPHDPAITMKLVEKKKRFIAGAVCPRCGAMDKVAVKIEDGNMSQKECIACGFNEDAVTNEVPAELETRVSRRSKQDVEVQPIKFFPKLPGSK